MCYTAAEEKNTFSAVPRSIQFDERNKRIALEVGEDYARLTELSGITTETRPSLDPSLSMRLAPGFAAPSTGGDGHVWRMGALGTAAMLVGMAEASLDLIVEYAKVRQDETFYAELGYLLSQYVGRPTPLYEARDLGKALAVGAVKNVDQIRRVAGDSFGLQTYQPTDQREWDAKRKLYADLA